jgi:hypothetical protein
MRMGLRSPRDDTRDDGVATDDDAEPTRSYPDEEISPRRNRFHRLRRIARVRPSSRVSAISKRERDFAVCKDGISIPAGRAGRSRQFLIQSLIKKQMIMLSLHGQFTAAI